MGLSGEQVFIHKLVIDGTKCVAVIRLLRRKSKTDCALGN